MNPTPPPLPSSDPAVAAVGQPLVEFIRGQRQNAAYAFLALSIAFLGLGIFLAVKSFKTTSVAADAPAVNPLDPTAPPEAPKVEISDPKKGDYTVGWIAALFGFLVTAGGGAWLLVGVPQASAARQQTEARILILAAGGLLGFALIIFGGIYFYRWSESLTKWLDRNETKERIWVVIPLLMVVAGAGLVFTAVQPARTEERNNLTLRRLVYGSNFGLTVLLLFLGLVVANVVISMKVPNKLDTTETGFYTLTDSTKNFLGKLPEPVTAYVIISDSGERLTNDIRQFIFSAQEASDGRFTARFVSPVSNKIELARLQEKYPRIGRDDEGILLTVGADEKRNAFVPFMDLFETDPRGRGVRGFAGENKVMRELRFLTENEQKPVIYFTQANGELGIGGTDAVSAGPSATQLKSFLEKAYVDVRPLNFALKDPTVPEDASVLVVAEPQTPLAPDAVGAIRKFMNEPRKSGGKGKLIVVAGATSGPNEKGVARTGLEGLLAEFNVQLGEKFLYSLPIQQLPDYRQSLIGFAPAAAQNPISQTIEPQVRAFVFFLPREVRPLTTNPQFQATPLLQTLRGRPTWLEDDRIVDPEQIERDLQSEAIRERRQFTVNARPVAVVVSEGAGGPHGGATGGSGRLLVIGNSAVFTDRYAERSRGTPPSFDLMSVGIDWLRERPPLATAIESKVYREYQFPEPSAVDTTRLLWFPLGLGLLTVIGLGAGVWVIRRK